MEDVGRMLKKFVNLVIYKLFSCSPNIPMGYYTTYNIPEITQF